MSLGAGRRLLANNVAHFRRARETLGIAVDDAGGHMDQLGLVKIVDGNLPAWRLVDREAKAAQRWIIEAHFLFAAHFPGAREEAAVVEVESVPIGIIVLDPTVPARDREAVPGLVDDEVAQLSAFNLASRILASCTSKRGKGQ